MFAEEVKESLDGRTETVPSAHLVHLYGADCTP